MTSERVLQASSLRELFLRTASSVPVRKAQHWFVASKKKRNANKRIIIYDAVKPSEGTVNWKGSQLWVLLLIQSSQWRRNKPTQGSSFPLRGRAVACFHPQQP